MARSPGVAEHPRTETKTVALADLKLVEAYQTEIPEPDAHDYGGLVESIRANGLYNPLTIDEHGAILDGYTRYRASKEAGLTHVPAVVLVGMGEDEKLDFIVEVNLRRRHLTLEQKRQIIRQYLKRHPDVSNRQVAQVAAVDHKTAGKVRTDMIEGGEIPQPKETRRQTPKEPDPVSPMVADHMDNVDIEVIVRYSARSSKPRKRGSGAWALPYMREDEKRKRVYGPFPVPAAYLRNPDATLAAKSVVEAFGPQFFRAMKKDPIEGVADAPSEDV